VHQRARHLHAPASLVLRLARAVLLARTVHDAEKARIKLSRWFAVCSSLATSCNARQCLYLWTTLRAKRGSMKRKDIYIAPFFRENTRAAKSSTSSSLFRGMSMAFRTTRAKIGASENSGSNVLHFFVNKYFLRYIEPEKRFARIRSDIGTQWR